MIVKRIRASRWAVRAPVRPVEPAVVADTWSGKLKEAEGELTDDDLRETQGKAEATLAESKEKAEDLGTAAERKLQAEKD